MYTKCSTVAKYAMSAEYYVYGRSRFAHLLTCELRISPRLRFATRRCGRYISQNLGKRRFHFLALSRLPRKQPDIFRTSSSSSHDFDTATRHRRCDHISYAECYSRIYARDPSTGHSASPFTVGRIFLAYRSRRPLTILLYSGA